MMTKQERAKAWNDFAAKVAEYIETGITDQHAQWFDAQPADTLKGSLRAHANLIANLTVDSQNLFAVAHLAQVLMDKLYPKPFCTRQAVEYLKQGKPVRPADNPDLVVLDICFGSALSGLINENYATFDNRPWLPIKDHFLIAWGNSGVVLARELPTHAEWVLASETEVKHAVERATKGNPQ